VIQLRENPAVISDEEHSEFDFFSLADIEQAFEQIELVSYQEVAKIRIRATGLTLKALPNGSSVGGTCWHIELSG
jgi:Cft2 family RNA processing exonuclease